MKSKTYSNRKMVSKRLLYIHLVFHTKYNRKMLNGKIRNRAEEIIRDVLCDLGCEVVKIRIQPNFIHILLGYLPKLAIAKIVNRVKGVSSCLLRREFPELTRQCEKSLWAPSYSFYNP